MFNIKLDKKSYKMSFKGLLVKIERQKTDRGTSLPPTPPPSPRADSVKQFSEVSNSSLKF